MAELNIKFWDISEWRKNLKFRSVRGAEEEEEEEEEAETGKSIEKGKIIMLKSSSNEICIL